ncbi:MAG TPA: hypothetical protein PKJ25_09525 [Smithellaceae bacterium]|nr:hypothetical protein [Smithellaceae bacterium]
MFSVIQCVLKNDPEQGKDLEGDDCHALVMAAFRVPCRIAPKGETSMENLVR